MNFEEIPAQVQKKKKPITTFPYIATQYLGFSRRGWRVIEAVEKMLEEYEVLCEPDFGSAWFYGEIIIKSKPKVTAGKQRDDNEETDPTPRLSLLKAANLNKVKESGIGDGLISVTRDTELREAVTLLILYDFSQLPILSGQGE